MPIWNKSGQLPQSLSREQKRSVIATDRGFVNRITYTDTHGNARIKDEVLVNLEGVANSSNFGAPSITDMWWANNTVANNAVATLYVSYDEPIAYANSTIGALKIVVANTSGGVSTLVAVSNTTIQGANNTLKFTFNATPAGTYEIQGQTMANAGATAITSLKSVNSGNEAITLTFANSVSAVAGSLTVTA